MITAVSPRAEQVLADALDLPEDERRHVADALQDSFEHEHEPELSPAWKAEIVKRVRSLVRGDAELVDGEEVAERVRREYAR